MNFTINSGGSAVTNVGYRTRSVSAAGITSCAASYATLSWSNNWSDWSEVAATTSISLNGLSSSNCYDVQIRGKNLAGYGGSSRESGKPVSAPSAPEIVSVTAGAASLGVAFSESADNGGAAITAYEYRIGSGSWISLATIPGFTLGTSTFFTISSLTNGTSYSITLRAVNSAGASSASTALTGTPVTTPAAPTISSVDPLDGALRVTFTAPTSTGGSAILGYQYSLNNGAWVLLPSSAAITSFTIPGLTNGTPYQVSLRAINARGNGSPNSFGNIAPGTVPEAPTISAIIVANQQVSLVVAPGLDGGWPLTRYEYSINSGAWVPLVGAPSVALANPIVITNLVNGTTYSFRVRSVNYIGESSASADANGTPATLPTAPSIVSTSSSDGALSIAFTAPTSNGGSTVSTYEYSVNGGTTWTRRASGGNTSPLVISGLTNGVAYNVKIRSVNGIGAGAESSAQTAIPQIPGAGRPISVTTTPLDSSVRISWAPPAAYVGAPIVGYRVNATPGTNTCTWTTGEYNCVISGLTNGTNYTFTVTSLRDDNGTTRDIDTSAASATTAPRTLPGAPTGISAIGGGNEATLSWSAPANNGGAAITDYLTEYSSDSGATWSTYSDAITAETSATVGGLTPGVTYRFRVSAINAAGVGASSTSSNSAKTFEQAPELTTTLDQQTADGFSFILSFPDPISFTIAATTNNPNAVVEQVGDYFTVRGLAPGASVTVTVTANRADYLQAITTIFSSALLAAPAPTVSAATSLDGAFRVTVDGYTANTTAGTSYAITTTAGAVIDDGAGVYRIVGLANGESAIATVTSSRPGYVTKTTSVSGSALYLGVPAQISDITGTREGFTFILANYAPEATYEITSNNSNAVISRTAELVTITGLTNLEVASVTVKTVRTGYMDASADVIGVALPQSEVNTLSAISLSNGAIAFDPATYEYSLNVSNTVSTYRVTPTKSDIDSTIAISINGGAFTSITSGAQSSALALNVGINTITIAVTSQVGSIQNYILYVNRAKSTVSTLGSISFSSGTITGFDAGLTTYDLTVPYGSSSITATLAPTNSAATMRIKANSGSFASVSSGVPSSALSLNVGNNLVVVEITAEDGLATSLYEFTVTRSGAANSQLGSLAISVGTMATFAPGTLNYEVIVPNGTTSATVTPTLGSGVTGSITVNGVDLADGATSAPISLTGGTTNQITIVVTASDGSSTPYVINVKVDAPPVALALTRESVGTQSNVAFTTQPQISINDAQSNRVLLNTSTVTVAITSGVGGQLIGATTATAIRGLATFATLGLRGVAGNTYTLTYSSGDLTIATQQITLTPGEASALAFRAGSTTVASGALFTTPLQVAAVDSDGNTVSEFGSAITVTVSGNGALSGSTIRTPASGIAGFTDLSLRGTAANSYTITASSSGLTNATRTVALTFGAPSALAITRASAGPVSGSVFTTQPEITIRDSAGNAVTSATGEVTASIASGVGGTLGGTTTVTLVNGVATFTDLVLSGSAGTAYTIAYSTSGVTSASEILTLSAGAAARVQLATPAAGFNNGTAFTRTQPVLRIQDSTGNTVATSNAIVTATVSSGGVLLGTTAQSASSGIVTFTNLGVFGTPGSTYTITFASPGLLSTTQTVLLTSGSSLTPTFGSTTPTIDGFTVQITNFNRIFNWTFSLLEGNPATQISLGGNGLLTVTGMPVGGSAIISATTSRNGFENGAATITGSTLLAPLNPTFSATTSTATGFRAQVTNFDSSFTWRISASNGGTAMISSTGLVTVIDLNPGVSSDVTVTTSKSGRVSASATVTGSATGLDTTTGTRDLAANLLTDATLYPICAGGTSANEGIGNLNDRNSKTKYLCFNASSRLNASYIRNSAGFYTGNIGSKLVTGIQFTSGDSDRSRDPIIYSLFGCTSLNGGCSPIVVNGRTAIDVLRNDTASVQSFLNTTPYNYYKVTFGALRTSWTDALQVAEVALIGTDANGAGLTPTFGAVTPAANGFTVQITNFNSAYTWRGSVNNNGGVSIGADGLVTVTGLAGATTGTVAITSSRPKFESATASISGTSLNSAFIPTFGAATPTADGFIVTIANYSSDYTWSASVTTGAATISGGVLTVTGQSAADQAVVTVITNRNGYATGRAQVVATALADGLTPNFGPSLGTSDGFTIQIRNYSNLYTWNLSASSGQAAINATGLITVTGLAAGASSTVTVSTSKTGSFTVITQAAGKAPIGTGLTPRFTLSTSTGDGFTAQILNYDAAYTWSGAVNAGSVTISGTGLVTVTGVSTGIMATATISTARAGYVSASNTIAGTAIAPRTQTIVGEDIKLEVPISAATSSTDVTVVVDIPVDAAPSSTSFTGRAVATDTVDQGLRTIRLDGSSGGSTVTTVSAPIAITIPASAGIGVPVYSPDGTNWVELPLLAAAALPEGQEMGYFKYDDGTILILTRKIGG
jgi:titin